MQERFQIKRITVKPGLRLSLQMHHHCHEHWVVVPGTARAQNGEPSILLKEDVATCIACGTVHRSKSPGVIPLERIGAQIGRYRGEEGIACFDDEDGRLQE